MFQELLLLFGLAALPAAFSFFLDFCLGKPGSNEPNTRAIFFEYTYSMAKARLVKEKRFTALLDSFRPQLENEATRKDGVAQFKLTSVLSAQPLFTWEQALGMCVYCSNFWVSMAGAILFFFTIPLNHFNPLAFFLIIPIISHLILRKL